MSGFLEPFDRMLDPVHCYGYDRVQTRALNALARSGRLRRWHCRPGQTFGIDPARLEYQSERQLSTPQLAQLTPKKLVLIETYLHPRLELDAIVRGNIPFQITTIFQVSR